jgi:hypothetical protein
MGSRIKAALSLSAASDAIAEMQVVLDPRKANVKIIHKVLAAVIRRFSTPAVEAEFEPEDVCA